MDAAAAVAADCAPLHLALEPISLSAEQQEAAALHRHRRRLQQQQQQDAASEGWWRRGARGRQLPEKQQQQQRHSEVSVPLVPGYGTHLAYIWVGTPPQRVSVIVDTGSHLTAFPCQGCKKCGQHTDPYFAPATSATAVTAQCTAAAGCTRPFICAAAGTAAATNDHCTFTQAYSEGSTWTAQQMTDVVRVSPPPPAPDGTTAAVAVSAAAPLMFGCISSQSGLFNTQLANGIMGISAGGDNTLTAALHRAGVLPTRALSLCLGEHGGVMTLGAAATALHAAPMAFTPLLRDHGWYTVDLLDIEVNGASIGAPAAAYNSGKGAIIDSGTTDTFLPEAAAPHFRGAWRAATGAEYTNEPMALAPDAAAALPALTFVFRGGARVTVAAAAYMERSSRGSGGGREVYTARVYLDERVGTVLGANFMRDHDVFFDESSRRVGFAPAASCSFSQLTSGGGGAAGEGGDGDGVRPLHPCTLSASMRLVAPCNARCATAGDAAAAAAAAAGGGHGLGAMAIGLEVWSEALASEGGATASCRPLRTVTRECFHHCGASHGDGDGGGTASAAQQECATAWGPCEEGCEQSRLWPTAGSAGGGGDACEHERRACHMGELCASARMGVFVSARVRMAQLSHGIHGPTALLWSPAVADAMAANVAALLRHPDGGGIAAGDVTVERQTAAGGGSDGDGGNGAAIESAIAVHVSLKMDDAAAAAIAAQLGSASFARRLTSAASAAAVALGADSEVAVTVLPHSIAVARASDGTPLTLDARVAAAAAAAYGDGGGSSVRAAWGALAATVPGGGAATAALIGMVIAAAILAVLVWTRRFKARRRARGGGGDGGHDAAAEAEMEPLARGSASRRASASGGGGGGGAAARLSAVV